MTTMLDKAAAAAWPFLWDATDTATHTNKKTGLQVRAVTQDWKTRDGQTVIGYSQIKDGERFGPSKSAVEARFNQMYAPL